MKKSTGGLEFLVKNGFHRIRNHPLFTHPLYRKDNVLAVYNFTEDRVEAKFNLPERVHVPFYELVRKVEHSFNNITNREGHTKYYGCKNCPALIHEKDCIIHYLREHHHTRI